MKLLHIDSSILGASSASRQITAAVVDQIRRSPSRIEVTYRDLATAPLPHLTLTQLPDDHPLATEATAGEDKALSQAALDEFLAADVVVIGAPMYNFTIPSQLKAWIDRILIPGKTFQYGPDGVKGLAGDKRVIIVISRGGFYGAGTPAAGAEYAECYLRAVFGFIGVNAEFIVAEGVQMGPEQRQSAINGALQIATALRAA